MRNKKKEIKVNLNTRTNPTASIHILTIFYEPILYNIYLNACTNSIPKKTIESCGKKFSKDYNFLADDVRK